MAGQRDHRAENHPPANLGAAAIDEYLADRPFGPQRRLPTASERAMIRDAREGFIVHEQWLVLEHDHTELIAQLRAAAATNADFGSVDKLLGSAADALTELGRRLALQRHAREIMVQGLVLQGEALEQARAGRARKGKGCDGGNPLAADPDAVDEPVSHYAVKFWRRSITADRMSIQVAAASPAAARERVQAWGLGELDLTAAEEASEMLEREELQDSTFDALLDPDEPNAVSLCS